MKSWILHKTAFSLAGLYLILGLYFSMVFPILQKLCHHLLWFLDLKNHPWLTFGLQNWMIGLLWLNIAKKTLIKSYLFGVLGLNGVNKKKPIKGEIPWICSTSFECGNISVDFQKWKFNKVKTIESLQNICNPQQLARSCVPHIKKSQKSNFIFNTIVPLSK